MRFALTTAVGAGDVEARSICTREIFKKMVTISCASRAALASSIAVLLTFGLSGCATTWRPIPLTPRVALTPTKGDVTTQARPGAPIGGIVPVDVSIANGTDEPYLVEPDQIFAINEQGQKIMPISANEAIQEAGNANALKAGLTGAAKNLAIGAIAGAATGAAIGAAVGTIVLSPAQGALVGAAIGGSVGAASGGVYGGVQGQAAAHRDAETQISALSLQTREAHPNYSINGYVFFPKGEYTSIQMTLLNEETHRTDVRTSSWEGGEIATGAGSATPMSVSPTPASPNVAQPSPAPLFQEQRQNETE
jgi:hypothetical protein